MERDEGWVLNLERRDGIMNINMISLFPLLLMSFACAVHVLILASFFFKSHTSSFTPRCVFFPPFRFYPRSVLDSFEVMASAHVPPPPSPEPPGSKASGSGRLPIGAAG